MSSPLYRDVHFYDYECDCTDPNVYPEARFISEFGFQSFPSRKSLESVSDSDDWESFDSFWRMLRFRERHENGLAQVLKQISRYFDIRFLARMTALDAKRSEEKVLPEHQQPLMDAMLYLSQIQQALCYETAIHKWRRGKRIYAGYTMGILYWQLNDVWTGISWSSMEHSGRWKSLQYAIKRAYAPIVISAYEEEGWLHLFAVSDDRTQKQSCTLTYELRKADDGHLVRLIQLDVSVDPLVRATPH